MTDCSQSVEGQATAPVTLPVRAIHCIIQTDVLLLTDLFGVLPEQLSATALSAKYSAHNYLNFGDILADGFMDSGRVHVREMLLVDGRIDPDLADCVTRAKAHIASFKTRMYSTPPSLATPYEAVLTSLLCLLCSC